MRVLFDLEATQPNSSGARHGGGRYGEILFRCLVDRGVPVSAFYNSGLWFNPQLHEFINERAIPLYDHSVENLHSIIRQDSSTMLYSPLPTRTSEIYGMSDCKVLGTIHDLRLLETPLDSYFWRYRDVRFKERIRFLIMKYLPHLGYRKYISRYGSLNNNPNFNFVTVSQHSSAAFRSWFVQYKDREIPVFYSPSTVIGKAVERHYYEKFYLLVSGNRWEKNNLRAIMALDRLFTMGYLNGAVVRITGVTRPTAFRYRFRNPDRFCFMGYVNDTELDQLYHDAYALIYPSLNEGFGYPPLEAMSYGVPVVASPFTSITEVCGDGALYFNPFSVEEIMGRLLQLEDSKAYNNCSKLALKRYAMVLKRQKADLDGLADYIVKLAKEN
ncbi:MAG: glycosyltransferase [Marinifilaceae bacterium]|nr:glycosyltransferase [Marinifilaceae bacterium]